MKQYSCDGQQVAQQYAREDGSYSRVLVFWRAPPLITEERKHLLWRFAVRVLMSVPAHLVKDGHLPYILICEDCIACPGCTCYHGQPRAPIEALEVFFARYVLPAKYCFRFHN